MHTLALSNTWEQFIEEVNNLFAPSHCSFLAAYLVTGGVSFLLGLLYFFVRLARPRKFGDISKLKEVDS
jgi:hypothetical protein